LSGTYYNRPDKRLIALLVGAATLIILISAIALLSAIGFGFPDFTLRLIFILWMILIIVIALAGYHWWGERHIQSKTAETTT